jgi:hypothetical protein
MNEPHQVLKQFLHLVLVKVHGLLLVLLQQWHLPLQVQHHAFQ